ncbi:MAG: sigma factor [Bacteroidales bacterium]
MKHDRRAQKYLYDRYSRLLMGICVRYATDVPEAEDILQESLLKIYLNIADYSGEGSLPDEKDCDKYCNHPLSQTSQA